MASHEHAPSGLSSSSTHRLAQGLGWFSIALGAAELFAAGRIANALGMEGKEQLLRVYGAREVATGIGILTSRDPGPWLWGRVAGDGLDIATLGAELTRENPATANVGMALAAVAGVTALDILCAVELSRAGDRRDAAAEPDYSGRSGFSRPAVAMRGAARDFEAPRDFQTPKLLRPYVRV